ncbi:hypothetical protein H632_c3750p0, partial [Helicosporidium sp. ATCC 50920]
MRLGLVACVLLAVVGMAAAADITDAFSSVVIEVPNPITIKAGAQANIDIDTLSATVASPGADGILTIAADTAAPTDAAVLTVDIATLKEISALVEGAKVTLQSLTTTVDPFTIKTAKDASVTGDLAGPNVVLEVAGGTVDLKGDIVALALTIAAKTRKNQAGAPADSTVKVDKVTGTATVTNPET